MNYIFDASPIIMLFEKCNLCNHFIEFSQSNQLLVPRRVIEECMEGDDCTLSIRNLNKAFKTVEPEPSPNLLPYFHFDDRVGEYWVISYALNHPDHWCVIDEEFGRDLCGFFRVNLTGTIGIVDEMKAMGLFSKGDLSKISTKARECNFYLSKKLLLELDKICEI